MDDPANDEGDATEDGDGIEDADAPERLWLVERTYTDKGLVSLVYATVDGEYAVHRQRSTNALRQGPGVTAAIPADSESLDPVDDEATRERYADEASRMADSHEPDESV